MKNENEEQVDKINQQLKDAGYDVDPPIHSHGAPYKSEQILSDH